VDADGDYLNADGDDVNNTHIRSLATIAAGRIGEAREAMSRAAIASRTSAGKSRSAALLQAAESHATAALKLDIAAAALRGIERMI